MSELTKDFDENYEIFLEDAIDSGVVWGIAVKSKDTKEENAVEFAVCGSEEMDGIDVMPFWSRKAFAQAVCLDEWADCEPQPVDVDDFIDNWLPGLQKDGLMVGINWTTDLEGTEIEPLELSLDLLETD